MQGTTVLPMDFIGVNEINGGSSSAMYAGKRLSWVRDNDTWLIKDGWGAVHRDFIIVGPNNGKIEAFNLTLNPLTGVNGPANRAILKQKLSDAATPADTDNDKLPDFWETNTYGNLSKTGASVEPGGFTVLQRYAFCSLGSGTVMPEGLPRIVALPDGSVSVFFTRRRGSAFGLTMPIEFSQSLSPWVPNSQGWEEWGLRQLYDGSGGETVEWKNLTPAARSFVRIKTTLP